MGNHFWDINCNPLGLGAFGRIWRWGETHYDVSFLSTHKYCDSRVEEVFQMVNAFFRLQTAWVDGSEYCVWTFRRPLTSTIVTVWCRFSLSLVPGLYLSIDPSRWPICYLISPSTLLSRKFRFRYRVRFLLLLSFFLFFTKPTFRWIRLRPPMQWHVVIMGYGYDYLYGWIELWIQKSSTRFISYFLLAKLAIWPRLTTS